MRAFPSLAMCSMLVGCSMFGAEEPDPFGIYDMVSIGGEAVPTTEVAEAWVELRADTTGTTTWVLPGSSEEYTSPFGEYSLGEMTDGCIPYRAVEWNGSICGDVFTITGPEYTAVFHKRR